MTWGKHYLMCPPTHFDVVYSINPWMNAQVKVDRDLAERQWHALVETLEDAGAKVEVIEPQPDMPDMVFTANAGMVNGRRFVPARMRHPERRGEAGHFETWFAQRGYEVNRMPEDAVQEGAGDALPVDGSFIGGYRTRSSAGAYGELASLLGARILPVELVDPRLYHIDLTLCPLDGGRAIVAPSGWSEEGRRLVSELVTEPLVLEPEEADAFSANSVVVGRRIVMPACSHRLRARLEEWGYEPVVVDVSEFLKAGGGPRCLTLALDVELDPRPSAASKGADAADLEDRFGAHNYHPLPVVVASGEGAWVEDTEGRRYLDALAAYSALNFGHRHPALVRALTDQLGRITLTSRAFHNDQLGLFCKELAELCGKSRVLPMNTGAEAIETALKTARKWGYEVKGVEPRRAKVIVCSGNFHGRTITIVSFSDDPQAREGFGPYTPGFTTIPYGDADALRQAIDEHTVAFLVEPVQGESGVIVPPEGYLRAVREICTERGVLMIADEIQSGLGRTGRTFACDHEGVEPDLYVLGKALGGGLLPLSAVVGDDEVLDIFQPGDHGSTFGGNPLACAVGREVIALMSTGELQERAARLGERLHQGLLGQPLTAVREVRARGLWVGIDLHPDGPPARLYCELLMEEGVLCKDAHEHTIRLAPPLVVSEEEVDWLLERLVRVLGGEVEVRGEAATAPLTAAAR